MVLQCSFQDVCGVDPEPFSSPEKKDIKAEDYRKSYFLRKCVTTGISTVFSHIPDGILFTDLWKAGGTTHL